MTCDPKKSVESSDVATINVEKYRILPSLSEIELNSLKESVKRSGQVEVPIVVDEHNNVLDGIARWTVYNELLKSGCKIGAPAFTVLSGLTDEQKRDVVLSANLARRHLNREQKRQIVVAELRKRPDIASDHLGEICGVDGKTVAKYRRELEEAKEIPVVTEFRRRDGKPYPATRVMAATPRQAEKIQGMLRELGPDAPKRTISPLDLTEAFGRKRRQVKAANAKPVLLKDIELLHSDFRNLRIDPCSVDLILTDPPYSRGYEDLWKELGGFSQIALKNDALLVSYSPTDCMTHFGRQILDGGSESSNGVALSEIWTIAIQHDTATSLVYNLRIRSGWRPVRVFAKGKYTRPLLRDLIAGSGREKDDHDWQQSLGNVIALIEMFSEPGDLVCDPCAGSFTTAIACYQTGRRFIGCDIDQDNVKIGNARLAEALKNQASSATTKPA